MRAIIDCDDEHYDAAAILLSKELVMFRERYDKIGWGWSFPLHSETRTRCFIRRIKDGLSLKQLRPKSPPSPGGET